MNTSDEPGDGEDGEDFPSLGHADDDGLTASQRERTAGLASEARRLFRETHQYADMRRILESAESSGSARSGHDRIHGG